MVRCVLAGVMIVGATCFAFSTQSAEGTVAQSAEETADSAEPDFGFVIDEEWVGSDAPEEELEKELAEEEKAEGEITERGIQGKLIVVNKTRYRLKISRGRKGRIDLGYVGPNSHAAFPVHDPKGRTKLWARALAPGPNVQPGNVVPLNRVRTPAVQQRRVEGLAASPPGRRLPVWRRETGKKSQGTYRWTIE